jgi:Ca-activated chloride channel family protein
MSDNHSGHQIATKQGTLVHQRNIKSREQYQRKLRQHDKKKEAQRSERKNSILQTLKKDVGSVVNQMRKMLEPKKTTGHQQNNQGGQQKKQTGQKNNQQTGQQTKQTVQKQTGKQQTGQQNKQTGQQTKQTVQKQTGKPQTVQKQGKQQVGPQQAGQQQTKQTVQKQTGKPQTVQKQTGKPQVGPQQAGQQQRENSVKMKTLTKELKNLYFVRRTQEEKKDVKNILEHIKLLKPTTEQIEQINRVLKSKDRRFPKVSKLILGGQTIYQMYPTYEKFLQTQRKQQKTGQKK